MGNKGQALRPEMFNIPSFIKKEREKDELELSEEEKILGQGATQTFWITLKKHIDSEIQLLDQIAEQAIEQGMNLEEIGRNTVVISQVKGVLTKIFNVVEDAREAIENGKTK